MVFDNFYNIIWIFIYIIIAVYFYLYVKNRGSLRFSSTRNFTGIKQGLRVKAGWILIIMRTIVIIMLVIGLMRPKKGVEESKIKTKGIAIELVLDVSGSMRAEDFTLNGKRENRLEVVKSIVSNFIKGRTNDQIGLVVFAKQAYTQCPLTMDYGVLLKFLDIIKIGMIEDGTAVGDGLATALARLKDVKAKSKVVILLTDGVNNAGKVDPYDAAELARATGIKVYAIGSGSKGRVPFPAKDFFGNKVYQWAVIDIDDKMLTDMAEKTGGMYFRATNTEALKDIYSKIDKMEKAKIETKTYAEYRELYIVFVIIALVILLLEIILRHTVLRVLP